MIRTFLILTLIAVAAIILFTRNHQPNQDRDRASGAEPPQPGYFTTDARIIQTGPDGMPMYQMRAERIQQNPSNLTVRMRHIELDYHATSPRAALGRTWKLTARQGDMPQTASKIDLSGNVEIIGQPLTDKDGLVARILTQKLSIDTESQVARTTEPVEMFMGDSRVSAVGLQVDMKAERIQLESKVHGRIIQ